jgi:hypothetical protein
MQALSPLRTSSKIANLQDCSCTYTPSNLPIDPIHPQSWSVEEILFDKGDQNRQQQAAPRRSRNQSCCSWSARKIHVKLPRGCREGQTANWRVLLSH